MSQWVSGKQLVRLLVILAAVPALAEPPVLNPNTRLALEPRLKSVETCVVLPGALYDPEACSGIPRGDSKTLPENNKSLHALAVMRWGETHVMLTVSSVTRPGIGQMSGTQIEGFLEAMLARLAEDFKVQPRFVEQGGQRYTLVRIQDVPVVRWEYTTDVPDTDPQASVASGVVFLVPSRDTLDLVSFNCHKKDLATARELGDQVISTLKVPVTIDTAGFGGRSWTDPGVVALLSGGLVLLLSAVGLLWWRRRDSSRG